MWTCQNFFLTSNQNSNQKANETHTQSSAEIEDVTPKPPPSPSVSPQKCVPSSPAAGQNEENQVGATR